MQSIETIYLGATNFRGSRIKANASGGESITIPYDFDADIVDAHAKAARALCERLNWKGTMIAGSTVRGYVFVFESEERYVMDGAPNSRIGYLIGSKHVVCDGCASKPRYELVTEPTPLFRENIGSYGQMCHDCAVVLVEPAKGWPTLFEAGPRSVCAYCPAADNEGDQRPLAHSGEPEIQPVHFVKCDAHRATHTKRSTCVNAQAAPYADAP